MADRLDFYFRQRVTEAELDQGFELLEKADRDLASDLSIQGIISGAVPTEHSPVADLSIDLTSPTRAYDQLGQRIYVGTDQVIDCASDSLGIPTEVLGPGNERWIAIFIRFHRQLSEPRTDGNAQQVFFRRDESFEIVVRQGPEAAVGAAIRVPLQPGELLVCDVRRAHGQNQLLNAHIDQSRRQAFIFAQGQSVGVDIAQWRTLQPQAATTQASLDEIDAELTEHFGAVGRRHSAADIDFAAHGFLAGGDVQRALASLLEALRATTGTPGAERVGASGIAGVPHALGPSNVHRQLSQLLGWLNTHVGALVAAHNASAIAAQPHAYVQGRSVQAQLEELVRKLGSGRPNEGGELVRNQDLAGAPNLVPGGTVFYQLQELLVLLNRHVGSADHDARYYRRGQQVDNADTLDGRHYWAFADAAHLHDGRYMRRTFLRSETYNAGETKLVTTLEDRPDIVTVSYNLLALGLPQGTTYVRGPHTANIQYWVTKRSRQGDKDYEISVNNGSRSRLYINVAAYRVGA